MNSLVLLTAFISIALCQEWTPVPGKFVHHSAKGKELWATDAVLSILRWNGKVWTYTGGFAQTVAAASDGRAFAVRTDMFTGNNIWRYVSGSNDYEGIDGTLQQISAATGDSAVGVSIGGDIYQFADNAWKLLPGKASMASIGVDDDIWTIDASSYIYRLSKGGGKWEQMPGRAAYIDVHSSTRVVIIDFYQELYTWTGSDWELLSGQKCVKASITNDKVYCQDIIGGLYVTNA